MARNKPQAGATDQPPTEPEVHQHTDETPPAVQESAADAASDDGALEEITVAPGRTISDADGDHGPGATMKVTHDEAERLRARGFAVAPEVTTLDAVDG